MDDLISRQAALNAIGDEPLAWTEGEYELGLQYQWQSDVDALNALPSAQPDQRWIPCNWQTKEENLPQECKSVLICMKDSCGYRIGVSYRTDYNRWEGYGRANVLAWMPLPEPYREDSEADGDG